MKIKKLKLLTVFLLLLPLCMVILGAGCEKEEEYEDISLQSFKCPCEHDMPFIKKITAGDILLFDAKETTWDEMKAQTFDGEKSEFISYSEESKSMIFYSIRTTMTGISYVCNIPEKINDWTIPSTGIVISFKADAFEACYAPPSIGFLQTNSEIILTTLKKRIK